MRKRFGSILIAASIVAGVAYAQDHPILDMVANRVIQKYQDSTCEQLWENRGKNPSEEEQRVIGFLKTDPQMRQEFFDKIAGTIMNKMFECGMFP